MGMPVLYLQGYDPIYWGIKNNYRYLKNLYKTRSAALEAVQSIPIPFTNPENFLIYHKKHVTCILSQCLWDMKVKVQTLGRTFLSGEEQIGIKGIWTLGKGKIF